MISQIELKGPVNESDNKTKQLIFFLHGWGSDGNDLIQISKLWKKEIDKTTFIAPHGPEPCAQNPSGRQWFDILSENNSGIDTKINVLTKVGPIKLTDIITVTEWKEKESIGVIHEGIVTGEGIFYLTALNESQTEFKWEETLKFPIYLGGVIGEFFGSYILKYIWKKNLKNLKEIIE